MNDEIKRYLEPGKKNLILVYILYLGGIIIPILPLIGVVFAFANMNHEDKRWRSHYILRLELLVLVCLEFLLQ